MKIIQKTQPDYYDGVINSLFHDSDLYWVRKEYTTHIDQPNQGKSFGFDRLAWNLGEMKPEWPFGDYPATWHYPFSQPKVTNAGRRKRAQEQRNTRTTIQYLCFCGKVYPIMKVSRYIPIKQVSSHIVPAHYHDTNRFHTIESDSRHIQQMFARYKDPMPKEYEDAWMNLCREHRTPVFLADWQTKDILWNPNLESLGFNKIVDAYTAAQEIFKFFANLGYIDPKIPEQTNDNKIEAAGFDLKSSFRASKKNR